MRYALIALVLVVGCQKGPRPTVASVRSGKIKCAQYEGSAAGPVLGLGIAGLGIAIAANPGDCKENNSGPCGVGNMIAGAGLLALGGIMAAAAASSSPHLGECREIEQALAGSGRLPRRPPQRGPKDDAVDLLREECFDRNTSSACLTLGSLASSEDARITALQRGCQGGSAPSCRALAEHRNGDTRDLGPATLVAPAASP